MRPDFSSRYSMAYPITRLVRWPSKAESPACPFDSEPAALAPALPRAPLLIPSLQFVVKAPVRPPPSKHQGHFHS